MNRLTDPVLLVLTALLAVSIMAFLLGFIPYPYGLIVLGFFIVARIFTLDAKDK